jgi:hypothetical protein
MRIAEPDLDELLGRFADAITLIRVSHRSLDALEVAFEGRNSCCGGDSPRSMPSITSSISPLLPSTHVHRVPKVTNAVHRRHAEGIHLGRAQEISGGIRSIHPVSKRAEHPRVSNRVSQFLFLTHHPV